MAKAGLKEKPCALWAQGFVVKLACGLVEDLQAELEDARLEGAGDLSTGGGAVELRCCSRGGWCAESAAEPAGRKVEVGVVEDVVGLGAELNLEAFHWSVEGLVEGEVGLVERGRAAGVA